MILSSYQAKQLFHAYQDKKKTVDLSLDLGRTKSSVLIAGEEFVFPDSQKLDISSVKTIVKKDTSCFLIEDSQIKKIAVFSDETNNYYKLMPSGLDSPPTIEISGIRMHVTKSMSPKEDTEKKISFIHPCKGIILDTCSGLGYTAIEASKTAELVYTIEKDRNVVLMQKFNPWSRELYESKNIKLIQGDIFEEIKKFRKNYFDFVIHDPPRLALSTLLYSLEFYKQLFRVLKKPGKIYHYTGNPGSKTRNLDIRAGVIKRMATAGFTNISRVFNGVTAESD